jgi:hypothetical protein
VTVTADPVANIPIPSSAIGVRSIVELEIAGDIPTLYDPDESTIPVPRSVAPE